ncbi:MAG: hypothetical protein GY769_08335 [bacterium]|nr:hypothetical protein [bacterium]
MTTLYRCGAGNSEGVRLALNLNRDQARWDRILLLDDDPETKEREILGVPVVGPFSLLAEADPESVEVVNLVARTTAKRTAARQAIGRYRLPFATLISPDVDTLGAELAQDLIVYQNATIGPEVTVEDGSVVFMGAAVGHESRVGRTCVVAANAAINARVYLEDGVYVGTNASILPEVRVGAWSTIGAGSVVMEDVPPGATVVGVPGQVLTMATNESRATTVLAKAPLGRRPGSRKADTDLERLVGEIWCGLLNVPSLDPQGNFFDAGATSLLALKARDRIQQATGHEVACTDLFRFPTVRALAHHIGVNGADEGSSFRGAGRGATRRQAMQRRRLMGP